MTLPPLPSYLYKTIGVLGIASLVLGTVRHPLLLPIALLGIRFSGQGLMSHISQTVMGRYFEQDRGKGAQPVCAGVFCRRDAVSHAHYSPYT